MCAVVEVEIGIEAISIGEISLKTTVFVLLCLLFDNLTIFWYKLMARLGYETVYIHFSRIKLYMRGNAKMF